MSSPPTHYARSGEARIAYQVLGDGPCDLVLVNGPASHLELMWEEPGTARSFRLLARFARLIMHDRRGTGLSDPVSQPPTLEQQVDDMHAVLDAVGAERIALIGGAMVRWCRCSPPARSATPSSWIGGAGCSVPRSARGWPGG